MGMMDGPHVVRRWSWHPTKVIKMRELRVGQYIAVNSNRWVRVNYITSMSDGTLMPMCGLNAGKLVAHGADAMFDMPPVSPDQEITVRVELRRALVRASVTTRRSRGGRQEGDIDTTLVEGGPLAQRRRYEWASG